MADSLALNDLIMCRWLFINRGNRAFVIRHYLVAAAGGGLTTQHAADGFDLSLTNVFLDAQESETETRGVAVRRIVPAPTDLDGVTNATAHFSLPGEGPLPPQTTGFVRLLAKDSLTRRPGHIYIPFPDREFNGPDGKPTDPYLVLAGTVASSATLPVFTLPLQPAGEFHPVIFHAATSGYSPVTGSEVVPLWATQRRRNKDRTAEDMPF